MAKTSGAWVPAYGTADFERAMSPPGVSYEALAPSKSIDIVVDGSHMSGSVVIKGSQVLKGSYSRVLGPATRHSLHKYLTPTDEPSISPGDVIRKIYVQAIDRVVGNLMTKAGGRVHQPLRIKVSARRGSALHRATQHVLDSQVAQRALAEEVAQQVARQMVELQDSLAVVTKQVEQTLQGLNSDSLVAGAHAVSTVAEPSSLLDLERTLSAKEFGDIAGVSDETVRAREKQLKVFSFLAPARTRGREYPAFQLHPKIYGGPLEQVLDLLRAGDGAFLGGADAYQFFVSPNPRLAMLTPAQLLAGVSTDESSAADALASKTDAERLAITKSAAVTFAANADA